MVIVVIGILAAISIISYRGIQSRAIDAGMQADASNVKKQIEIMMVETGVYPTSLATLNQGRGVTASNSATYQYSVNNGVSPATFCLTITSSKSSNSYYVGNNSVVQSGLCAGHTAYVAGPSYTFTNLTWTTLSARPVARAFIGLATSANGQIVAGTDNSGGSTGYIYRSADSGATWTQLTSAGLRRWSDIDMSSDGQKIIAAVDGSPGGYVYTSSDSGVTWSEHTSVTQQNWRTVASSADGMVLAAGYEIGAIYMSYDGGATWNNATSALANRRWGDIAMSSNGQRIYATARCGTNSGFVESNNSGATWVVRASTPTCATSVASSASGNSALAAVTDASDSWMYTADSGLGWSDWAGKITTTLTTYVTYIDMSDDGTKIVASRTGAKFAYVSKDSGATWITYSTNTGGSTSLDAPRTVTVSGDGATYYINSYNGLYKGQFD